MTFWFLTNAWNSICRPGPCQPPIPPVQRPLGSLPHSCKNTLLVQVREILWATKQQVEVSTPDTISSAITPCSEDRSAPIRGDHMSSGTGGISGVQWQERDDWRSDTDCHPNYPVPSHLLSYSRDLSYGDPDLPKPQLSYISASALDIYYHLTFFIV